MLFPIEVDIFDFAALQVIQRGNISCFTKILLDTLNNQINHLYDHIEIFFHLLISHHFTCIQYQLKYTYLKRYYIQLIFPSKMYKNMKHPKIMRNMAKEKGRYLRVKFRSIRLQDNHFFEIQVIKQSMKCLYSKILLQISWQQDFQRLQDQ